MRSRLPASVAAVSLLATLVASPAAATTPVVAAALTDGSDSNVISFVNEDADVNDTSGDAFAVVRRPDDDATTPWAILDDSLTIFPGDEQGIVDETDTAPFLAAVDTDTDATATWALDVSGVTGPLFVNVDLAAMGDFEASDVMEVRAAVDGGDAIIATATIDEAGSRTYTLADGDSFVLNDPANVGSEPSVPLTADFTTVSLPVPAGDTLAVTVVANLNSGGETFAARNIVVTAEALGPVVATAPPPPPPATCTTADEDLTLISEVQGSNPDPDARWDSPLDRQEVTIRGVVTLADDDLDGYFVQEEPVDDDGDPTTSEGLFVFDRRELPVEGQTVELTGTVTAFFGLTQLSFPDTEVCPTELVTIAPTPLQLPLDRQGRENLEGMLVTNGQDLQVTGLFTAYRFGELGLALDGPLIQPTSVFAPGDDAAALADDNADRLLKVNDRNEAFGQWNPYPWERFDEGLSAGDTFPAGRVVGALGYSFGDFKIEPVDNEVGDPSARIFFPESDDTDVRQPAPALADGNDVVAFNVLNYFNDFDGRGARNADQFADQTAKIVDAITAMDAAVLGLVELENDYGDHYDDDPGTVPSVQTLVGALNDATAPGTYDWVVPDEDILIDGGLGPDAIAQGLIYQPAKAEPVGPAATFDIDALLSGDSDNNRWPLAQTFKLDGEFIEVVVNHFKSKGSPCTDTAGPGFAFGDDVGSDLTGNCNLTRVYAAERLVEWVAGGATGFPTNDTLLVGDFNAYEEEAPIETLVEAGFTDLVEELGNDAFTYKFDGRFGRLDYAFASPSLLPKVTDAAVWQANSREPVGFLYYNDPIDLTAYASSDHDPVIVSLVSDGVNGADGRGQGKARGRR